VVCPDRPHCFGAPAERSVLPTRRKRRPHETASATGRWAEIIFRSLATRVANRWRFVSFRGRARGEWRGVVDVLAIRKDTSQPRLAALKRGDLFDIVLVQIKGGSARLPTLADRRRLHIAARRYGAREVVLFQWRKGVSSEFATLGRSLEWTPTTGAAIFGQTRRSGGTAFRAAL
jgi:hypothetical protein